MTTIYEEIEARRVEQRANQWFDDDRRTQDQWALLVTNRAMQGALQPSRSVFREAMLRAATLCIAAIEAHDAEGEVRG